MSGKAESASARCDVQPVLLSTRTPRNNRDERRRTTTGTDRHVALGGAGRMLKRQVRSWATGLGLGATLRVSC